jgi:hypothetical protein
MVEAIQKATPNFPAWVVWPIALLAVLNAGQSHQHGQDREGSLTRGGRA